jgi:hypothetical protein
MKKVETFSMRVKPEIKAALLELAARESRTAAGQIEALVREKCRKLGIEITTTKLERNM